MNYALDYAEINYIDTLTADTYIAGEPCFICEAKIKRTQAIVRIIGKRFVHRRKCWNTYVARTVRVYDLKAVDVMRHFGFSMRTTRRILAEARRIKL